MLHQNTVFHSLLKHVPWHKLEQSVEKYAADKLSRELTTKRHVIALLYGQFCGAASLREIVTGMASQQTRLYHVGANPVKRTTLSDANRDRPYQVFGELCTALMAQAQRGLRRATAEAVRLIDSTSVRLSSLSADWADFSADWSGVKAHIVYDPNVDQPVYFAVTRANVNDIMAAKAMPIEPGATYAFDLGYYDYRWWAKIDDAGCRFVTRLKKNTPLSVVHEALVLAGITNDLDAPAAEIADIYKQRWQIELFFRWVKQTLRIKRFIGVSENAVRIQIAVALIAFLLLRLAQAAQKVLHSPLEFARLVRANLMSRRPLDRLLEPLEPVPINSNQLKLALYFT